MSDKYGHFSKDGSEFIITTPQTPRHWFNYLWNDSYISFVSQVGFGEAFAQDAMGKRVMLVTNRNMFVVDARKYWTANALPVWNKREDYSCAHGLGYTEIKQRYLSIETRWRVFVPDRANCEVWSLRVVNRRPMKCSLKLIPYIRTAIDDFYRPQGYYVCTGGFDAKIQALIAKRFVEFNGGHEIYGYMASSKTVSGYDCRQSAFIGEYGEELSPQALVGAGGCANSDCIGEKLCFALETSLDLEPGESGEVHFIAGLAASRKEVAEMRSRIFEKNGVDAELEKVKEKFLSQIAQVRVKTPDRKFDCLVNYWLKHQANMGSRWARVRHNGYRDLSCDCDCFASVNPALAWKRLKRVLSFQYSSGYAPRTWIDGKILDRNFMDNTVWLTYAVYDAVMEAGRLEMLRENVPFNDGSSAAVFEHIKRSVDYLWNFRGKNGLIRIWGGDWNDCMERVGIGGKGTSVWLSMAWFRANSMFAELARLTGRESERIKARQRAKLMREAVDKVAWNGEYYTRAYTDAGTVLGSKECEEGKIFANPQIWAVLSGISRDGKDRIAMKAVDKRLDSELGLLVSFPPYTYRREDIGHMTEKAAGVHENGGVYLHPAAWKIAADAMLNRNAKIEEGLEKMLPFGRSRARKDCEPYILCNSYYSKATGYNYGAAGQSWRTGSGPWLLKAIINYIFGLRPEIAGLRLDPCLPPGWTDCSISKQFRGATYNIRFHQDKPGNNPGIREITVNGKKHANHVLPYAKGGTYEVRVVIGSGKNPR